MKLHQFEVSQEHLSIKQINKVDDNLRGARGVQL